MNKNTSVLLKVGFVIVSLGVLLSCRTVKTEPQASVTFPAGYLEEALPVPGFWLTTIPEIDQFLKEHVKTGHVSVCGVSAGGRSITSVSYGKKRVGTGTTTFSGSLSVADVDSYRGPDGDRLVYMGISGVHGFELEGIVGTLNLIEVMETGRDLRGKPWPELKSVMDSLDRIVLLPLVNPDGRARLPIRTERFRGCAPDSYKVHSFLNTGGRKDGQPIGWPNIKRYIPMEPTDVGFLGGYPNDAGVNIMHDDFLGSPQPETIMLLDIAAAEKPDLIMNMHTGVPKNDYYMQVHRPFCEADLQRVFDTLYRRVKTGLAEAGLQGSRDLSLEADPSTVKMSKYNLNTALNLHCGALCVVVESPSHGYGGTDRKGNDVVHTFDMLVDAQLIAHYEAMKFLLESGGRSEWTSR